MPHYNFNMEDFTSDPIGTIKNWRGDLFAEYKNGHDYRQLSITRFLEDLSQSELNSIAGTIIDHIAYEMKTPPGMPILRTAYDELVQGKPENYSAKHIVSLMFSIKGTFHKNEMVKPKVAEETKNENKTQNSAVPIPAKPENKNEIELSYGSGIDKVTFHVLKSVYINEEKYNLMPKLERLHPMIVDMNRCISQRPVNTVYVILGEGSSYSITDHSITVGILENNIFHVVVREMGHAIGHVKFGGKFTTHGKHFVLNDKDIYHLYIQSLQNELYELIEDSKYFNSPKLARRAYEDSWEFFASALAIFVMHGDSLLELLNNPKTPAERSAFGRNIFIFIRDKVLRKTYTINDPFENTLWTNITLPQFNINDNLATLLATTQKYEIKIAACRAIVADPIKDTRYVEPLVKAIQDKEINLRSVARNAILALKDARFIGPLQDIKNKDPNNAPLQVTEALLGINK